MALIRTLLSPLASLKLTVWLFALSMVLILAGTLAQVDEGVWTVVDRYFRSGFVLIELRLFVPEKIARVPGVVPFPGGLTLGVLIFVNLLAAHAVRFKLSWKRAGIIVTHAGVLLLLVGEFVTGALAREGNMAIDEGASADFVEDIREAELALIDPAGAQDEGVVVIPQHRLAHAEGGVIGHPALACEVRVDAWMPNSVLVGPMQMSEREKRLATAGLGLQVAARPTARATGVGGSQVDAPSAYVTLLRGGRDLGTYLVTVHADQRQEVMIDGKPHELALRFRRTYKPYSIHLVDFRHDKFVGTDKPRNFSSLVRLRDPTRGVDREVLISMNSPLRYRGETFYQSAFKPDNTGTVLQVVDNPGWVIPYVSCVAVTLGMLVHFGIRLAQSAKRVSA